MQETERRNVLAGGDAPYRLLVEAITDCPSSEILRQEAS